MQQSPATLADERQARQIPFKSLSASASMLTDAPR
jgi:hypothetical protein